MHELEFLGERFGVRFCDCSLDAVAMIITPFQCLED